MCKLFKAFLNQPQNPILIINNIILKKLMLSVVSVHVWTLKLSYLPTNQPTLETYPNPSYVPTHKTYFGPPNLLGKKIEWVDTISIFLLIFNLLILILIKIKKIILGWY
jgi:hypothetical protein